MKAPHPIKDFFNIDPVTRRGYMIVLGALVGLTFLRVAIIYLPEQSYTPPDAAMIAQWQALKNTPDNGSYDTMTGVIANMPTQLHPKPFDPNTVDSASLAAMGLKAYTIAKFLHWRQAGMIFRNKTDFSRLYSLSAADYKQLEPYIVVRETYKNASPRYANKNYKPTPEPQSLPINTCTLSDLVLIKGIGEFTAHKIITYRNELGGYYNIKQLKEAYRLPDSVMTHISQIIMIDTQNIKRMNINTVDEAMLTAHPYINDVMAKNIILYRSGIGSFTDIRQLKQVPKMDEEKYRKIAPYFILN